MIDEIKTFREKYPEYNEMPDMILAARLATQYPEAYKDLPLKVFKESHKQDTSDIGPVQEFAIGVGKGASNIVLGAKQRAAELGSLLGISSPETVKELQAQKTENERVFSTLSEGRAETVSRPYLEKGEWKTQESPLGNPAKIGEFAGEAGMLSGIPGGATGGFVRRGLTGLAAGATAGLLQPTSEKESVAGNVAIGGAVGGVTSVALSGMGKLYNAIVGNAPETEITKQSAKYGIRTSLGEVLENPIVKKMETWLEAVPLIGLKGFREKQNKEAMEAAATHFTQYVADPAMAQSSTAAMKVANDMHLDDLYDTVRKNAKNIPKVEATELKPATLELLDRFPNVFDSVQDTKIKRILKDIRGDVATKTVDTGLVGVTGKPLTRQEIPTFSFDDLWELRKGVGREMRDAKTDVARSELGKVYSAVSDDLDTLLSQSNTPVLRQFKEANEAFKQYSVKFDVLRQTYDKAAGTTGAGEMFSPKTYSTALKNLANDPNYKKNVKWSPGEVDEMTGLANILQVTKRAGQYAENPPTGNRWGLPITAGLLKEGAILATVPITALASFLTGTSAGKMFARAASKVEPDSTVMKFIVNSIYNQMPKAAAIGAEQAMENQQK